MITGLKIQASQVIDFIGILLTLPAQMFYNLQLVRCTKGRPASITLESACDEGGSGRAIPQAP
jgi:hypothetical protein